ncbi:hypothetical protein BJ165DRAFT_415314 [Panaeolus papilionaceus]|nr:hypothetical protein BJ165DRAFT_415314 [Panaeolus papilionaceus]
MLHWSSLLVLSTGPLSVVIMICETFNINRSPQSIYWGCNAIRTAGLRDPFIVLPDGLVGDSFKPIPHVSSFHIIRISFDLHSLRVSFGFLVLIPSSVSVVYSSNRNWISSAIYLLGSS